MGKTYMSSEKSSLKNLRLSIVHLCQSSDFFVACPMHLFCLEELAVPQHAA
jgi:hypothetical protein